MARPLKITITETTEELKKRLDRTTTASNKERLLLLYWLKIGLAKNRKELTAMLFRHEATITRWLQKYKKGGMEALLEVKKAPGKTSKISSEALIKLEEELKNTEGFSSYGEIQQWLEANYQIKVAYHTIYKKVRYKLQAKLKTPRPYNSKKDKVAQDLFKKT